MLNAVFYRKNGRLCECSIQGHAGFAEHGHDVVCAAVSSATQLTANLLTETFRQQAEVSVLEDTISIRTDGSDISAKLLDAFYVHLQCISEEFPNTIHLILRRCK